MADHDALDLSSVLPMMFPEDASGDPGSPDASVHDAANKTEAAASASPTPGVEEKQKEKEEEKDDTFGDRIVYLFVGPKRVKYTIHERVLSNVAKNSFFSALFNNGFRETSTGQAEMPEDDPVLFGYLIKWLYAAHVDVKNFDHLFNGLPLQRLFQLYNVGQKFLIEDFQDAIITTVYDRLAQDEQAVFTFGLDSDALDEFQDNIIPECNMYKLVSRVIAVSMLQQASICHPGSWECNGHHDRRNHAQTADDMLPVMSDELIRDIFNEMLWVEKARLLQGS